MKLNIKDYKIIKTNEYFKSGNLIFFVNGPNQGSLDWLFTKQGFKTVEFNCYKVLNKTTIKTLNISTYANVSSVIKGSTFFIKPKKTKPFLKQTILKTFSSFFFELLIIKFNNKIYQANSLKNTYSLKYNEIKVLFYQFNIAHLKIYSKFSK